MCVELFFSIQIMDEGEVSSWSFIIWCFFVYPGTSVGNAILMCCCRLGVVGVGSKPCEKCVVFRSQWRRNPRKSSDLRNEV